MTRRQTKIMKCEGITIQYKDDESVEKGLIKDNPVAKRYTKRKKKTVISL